MAARAHVHPSAATCERTHLSNVTAGLDVPVRVRLHQDIHALFPMVKAPVRRRAATGLGLELKAVTMEVRRAATAARQPVRSKQDIPAVVTRARVRQYAVMELGLLMNHATKGEVISPMEMDVRQHVRVRADGHARERQVSALNPHPPATAGQRRPTSMQAI